MSVEEVNNTQGSSQAEKKPQPPQFVKICYLYTEEGSPKERIIDFDLKSVKNPEISLIEVLAALMNILKLPGTANLVHPAGLDLETPIENVSEKLKKVIISLK